MLYSDLTAQQVHRQLTTELTRCASCSDDAEGSQPFLELFRQHMQRSCSSVGGDGESIALASPVSRCAANLAHEAGQRQHEKLCAMVSRAQQQAAAQPRGGDDIPAAHALDRAWQVPHAHCLPSWFAILRVP